MKTKMLVLLAIIPFLGACGRGGENSESPTPVPATEDQESEPAPADETPLAQPKTKCRDLEGCIQECNLAFPCLDQAELMAYYSARGMLNSGAAQTALQSNQISCVHQTTCVSADADRSIDEIAASGPAISNR